MGWAPPADALLSLRFLSLSSARSYTTAGSFVRWLLDEHGAPVVRRLYATGGDFHAAFGVDQATLLAGWRQMLSTIQVASEVPENARERFPRGGVFSRPCTHAIAARRAAKRSASRRATADQLHWRQPVLRGRPRTLRYHPVARVRFGSVEDARSPSRASCAGTTTSTVTAASLF